MALRFKYSTYWRFPISIAYVYLFGVGLYILNTFYPNPSFVLISTQLRLVSSAILFAQGLSLVWYVADYYRIHWIMKWLVFFLAAFTQAFPIITVLGVVDSRFDVRDWIVRSRSVDK